MGHLDYSKCISIVKKCKASHQRIILTITATLQNISVSFDWDNQGEQAIEKSEFYADEFGVTINAKTYNTPRVDVTVTYYEQTSKNSALKTLHCN